MDVLFFGLSQHLAPRVVQAQGYMGEIVQPEISILAGCKLSAAFTRAYLKQPLQEVISSNKRLHVGVHIDDVPITTTGSKSQVEFF